MFVGPRFRCIQAWILWGVWRQQCLKMYDGSKYRSVFPHCIYYLIKFWSSNWIYPNSILPNCIYPNCILPNVYFSKGSQLTHLLSFANLFISTRLIPRKILKSATFNLFACLRGKSQALRTANQQDQLSIQDLARARLDFGDWTKSMHWVCEISDSLAFL